MPRVIWSKLGFGQIRLQIQERLESFKLRAVNRIVAERAVELLWTN